MADESKVDSLFESDDEAQHNWIDWRKQSSWRMDQTGYNLIELAVGSEVLYLATGGVPHRLRDSEIQAPLDPV